MEAQVHQNDAPVGTQINQASGNGHPIAARPEQSVQDIQCPAMLDRERFGDDYAVGQRTHGAIGADIGI